MWSLLILFHPDHVVLLNSKYVVLENQFILPARSFISFSLPALNNCPIVHNPTSRDHGLLLLMYLFTGVPPPSSNITALNHTLAAKSSTYPKRLCSRHPNALPPIRIRHHLDTKVATCAHQPLIIQSFRNEGCNNWWWRLSRPSPCQ